MNYSPILPEASDNYREGRQKLAAYQRQAETLNAVLAELRDDGRETLSLDDILFETALKFPAEARNISREMFYFSGRRVVVNARAFFAEYEQTPEGRRYRDEIKNNAPWIYGKFTYLHF